MDIYTPISKDLHQICVNTRNNIELPGVMDHKDGRTARELCPVSIWWYIVIKN